MLPNAANSSPTAPPAPKRSWRRRGRLHGPPASALHQLRVDLGATSRDVAEATGYSQRYVQLVESLQMCPSDHAAETLALYYGITVEELRALLRPVDTPAEAAA